MWVSTVFVPALYWNLSVYLVRERMAIFLGGGGGGGEDPILFCSSVTLSYLYISLFAC